MLWTKTRSFARVSFKAKVPETKRSTACAGARYTPSPISRCSIASATSSSATSCGCGASGSYARSRVRIGGCRSSMRSSPERERARMSRTSNRSQSWECVLMRARPRSDDRGLVNALSGPPKTSSAGERVGLSPIIPTGDAPDLREGNAVLLGQRAEWLSGGPLLPDGSHVGRREFGATVTLTRDLASLVSHVFQVVPLRAEEEVVRARADRVVAMMEHEHPGRDRAVVKLPRDPVGANARGFVVDRHDGVAVVVDRARPGPAAAGLLDLRPVPLLSATMSAHCESLFHGAKPQDASGVA